MQLAKVGMFIETQSDAVFYTYLNTQDTELTVTRAINEHAHNPKPIFAASSNLCVASTTSDIITAPISPTPNSRQMHSPTKPCHK